jgi:hypothetical protein
VVSNNIFLGGFAGVTIFFGLLVVRWRNASERVRGLLALASAGVLLFLIIEVGYRAMETVEAAAKQSPRASLRPALRCRTRRGHDRTRIGSSGDGSVARVPELRRSKWRL